MLICRLLGPVDVSFDDEPIDLGFPRQRTLLAILLVEANRLVTVDSLIDRIWADRPPARPSHALYTDISKLRRALTPARGLQLVRHTGGYRIDADPATIDLHRFRTLRAQARSCDHDEDAAAHLDEALALWRGEAFTDLTNPWLTALRGPLNSEKHAALLDRNDAYLRLGRHTHLLTDLAAASAAHPLDERLAAQHMLALYRCDRPADALTHYHHTQDRLAEELGVDPGPALRQLHEQILRNDPDLRLTTPLPTPERPPTPRQLHAYATHFVGRAAELDHLTALLDTTRDADTTLGDDTIDAGGGTVVISAIGGTGGIGKTWLALTWAHRNLHRFPDGQLAVDLRGFSPSPPRAAVDVLAEFLAALGVDRDRQPQDLEARVGLYRTHTTGKRMLVLLDNAANPDQVVPLLPGGACTVLITSRNRLHGLVARHSAYPVHLDVLTDTDARTLLTRALDDAHSGTYRSANTEWAVTELIGLCGGFPLALGLIAARIRTYPDLLHDLVTDLHELGVDALDSGDSRASLPTVLSWSLRHLTHYQHTLFGLLGIAPGPDTTLPAVVALTGLSPTDARAALSALEEASLLERRPGGRYGMHDLVRDYAATIARDLPEGVRESALVRVMDFHLHTAHAADRLLDPHRPLVYPGPPAAGVRPLALPDVAAAMAWLEAEHATLLATQRAANVLGRRHLVWHFAWTLDTFHFWRGHRRDALAVWQAALEAAAQLPDPATRSRAHRMLGRTCSLLGLHKEAIEHLDRALDLAMSHHDPTEQAHTHQALTVAWEQRGDDRQALDHARHALDLHRTLDQPAWEADALNQVGWFAARLGEFDTADDHCRAALTLHRRHHNLRGQAFTLDSLGFIAHHTGAHQQALDHYHQAIALFRTIGNTSQVADALNSAGHPHIALGHHEQARAVWREALQLYREQGRDTDADRVQHQLDELNNDHRNGK